MLGRSASSTSKVPSSDLPSTIERTVVRTKKLHSLDHRADQTRQEIHTLMQVEGKEVGWTLRLVGRTLQVGIAVEVRLRAHKTRVCAIRRVHDHMEMCLDEERSVGTAPRRRRDWIRWHGRRHIARLRYALRVIG